MTNGGDGDWSDNDVTSGHTYYYRAAELNCAISYLDLVHHMWEGSNITWTDVVAVTVP